MRALTVAEYLDEDEHSRPHLEFHEGEVRPVDEGDVIHARLVSRVASLLECGPGDVAQVSTQLRVHVSPAHYFYPDVSAGPRGASPSLIVEILSAATDDYDRGRKFEAYQLLPALREYVLIDQPEKRVHRFWKTAENDWLLQTLTEPQDLLELDSGVSFTLEELYRNALR